MKNRVAVCGDIASIEVKRRNGDVLVTTVDASDLPMIELFNTIYVKLDRPSGMYYASASRSSENGSYINVPLHRLIVGAQAGYVVDHINHDTLDNRKCNLRLASQSENQQNRIRARKDNKSSGIRGVSWHKQSQKWAANIRVNGKRITVGEFRDIHDAERAVIRARAKHMPFSPEYMEVDA